jgi:TATA-box binding protein (TBP) (component of TFIID and TFIIIB)
MSTPMPEPTPLRISTMTVTGHLGVSPDLKKLFHDCAFIPYWWIGEGILKIELGDDKRGLCSEDILHSSAKSKKRFFNQSSLVFRMALTPSSWKEVNIKLFKNGGFQMTGISSESMARIALTRLIELNWPRGIWPGTEKPWLKTFNICMINSDYSIGKAIRRDRLYKILVEEYGLWSSFEPTIYQGVNTKFFWNSAAPPAAPPGICVCPTPCEGNADGHGVGHCKKITISPFRTGSIIITGAKSMRQLDDAYNFMNGILRKHAAVVLREEGVAMSTEAPVSRKKLVPLGTPEAILRQRMRASPRNLVRLSV